MEEMCNNVYSIGIFLYKWTLKKNFGYVHTSYMAERQKSPLWQNKPMLDQINS